MSCFGRTSDLAVLLIWGVFEAASSCMNGNQTAQNGSWPLPEVSTPVSVQMGTKALLCCPAIPLTKALLITWEIAPRDQPPCRISYRAETRETNKTNCTDRRITWASSPDQSPNLQINAVALDHDGNYSCVMATPNGNFQVKYDLQVLVPPEVTLSRGKNRTAVCEATAGKPAAQIFWTPDGHHVTKNEPHSNGTVTVRSTYSWEQNNVSSVSCFVFHSTGNQTLSIQLNRGRGRELGSYIPYIILSIIIIIILTIIGCIWLLKISGFRKCKWTRPETSSVVEEDDMQPYASYTEKSNPLYDTVTKVEACSMPQGEVNGTDWLALSATGI